MTPEVVREWVKIGVSIVSASVGVFMLVHETIAAHGEPNLSLIGAGLALLGIPPALHFDGRRRKAGEVEEDA